MRSRPKPRALSAPVPTFSLIVIERLLDLLGFRASRAWRSTGARSIGRVEWTLGRRRVRSAGEVIRAPGRVSGGGARCTGRTPRAGAVAGSRCGAHRPCASWRRSALRWPRRASIGPTSPPSPLMRTRTASVFTPATRRRCAIWCGARAAAVRCRLRDALRAAAGRVPAVRCATARWVGARPWCGRENCSRHRGRWIGNPKRARRSAVRGRGTAAGRPGAITRTLRLAAGAARRARVEAAAAADLDGAGLLLEAEVASRLRAHQEGLGALDAKEAAFHAAWERLLVEARRAQLALVASAARRARDVSRQPISGAESAALAGRDPATWRHEERHTAAKALAYVARFAAKTSPNGVFLRGGSSLDRWDRCRRRGPKAAWRGPRSS